MKRLLICTLLFSTLLLCGCLPKETPPQKNTQSYARDDGMWQAMPIANGMNAMWRTPTPVGWLVTTWGGRMEYIPDPEHKWLKTQ